MKYLICVGLFMSFGCATPQQQQKEKQVEVRIKYKNIGRPSMGVDQRLTYIQVGVRGADKRRIDAIWNAFDRTKDCKFRAQMVRAIFQAGLERYEQDLAILEAHDDRVDDEYWKYEALDDEANKCFKVTTPK